jgi:hypothetical protein
MNVMGIVLLIVGALAFLASFVVSDRDQDGKKYSKAMGLKLDRMIDERVDELKVRLSDVAGAAREEEEMRAQRELERITNEKIMAIDDYSRAVLEEIEKNHKEVMFLYDMLESKTSDVKNTIRKADAVKREQESVIEETAAPAPAPAPSFAPEPEPESEKKISGMDKLRTAFAEAEVEPSPEDIADAIRDEMGGLELDEPELSRNDKVLEMKKSGMENVDIAKALNIGVGEVNLITDLFSGDDGNGGEG